MSGLGRRSHYRKHLTDSVLHDFPEPTPPNERIAKVVGTRGSNQFELVVDPLDGPLDETPQLAILPTKFRKLVWLKRNDYVICVVGGEDDKGDEGGIRYMIEHILYKEQVKHLKEKGMWPKDRYFWDEKQRVNGDDEDLTQAIGTNVRQVQPGGHNTYRVNQDVEQQEDEMYENGSNCDGYGEQDEDGIVYNPIDEEYFCNMNRVAKLKVADSSDESEDSD